MASYTDNHKDRESLGGSGHQQDSLHRITYKSASEMLAGIGQPITDA